MAVSGFVGAFGSRHHRDPDRDRAHHRLRRFVRLAFLWLGVLVAVIIAWFAILLTGRYPRGLFDYVVGVGRWHLRVVGNAFALVTDVYPPFRLTP